MSIKYSMGLGSLLLTSTIVSANVSGTVFKDLPLNGTVVNTYGTQDSNEKGIAGVTVTAYPSNKSTTTDASGKWSLDTSGKVKIEFTNIPTGLRESAGQSSVQFIDGESTTINLALYNPSEYSDGKSSIAVVLQPNTTIDSELSALQVLVKDNINSAIGNPEIKPVNKDIPFNKLGTIWGLAYDKASKTIYASASLRRHADIGKDGLGAIYKIKDGEVELFTKIDNVGTIPDNRGVTKTGPNHDKVFDEVGRVGLGDLDISEDRTKLYTVNLNTNEVIIIDIKTKTKTKIAIGDPFNGCSDVKSWGLGQNNGILYVGSVCTTDMTKGAYISKLEGSEFKPFHQIPLDMDGETSLDTLTTNGLKHPNNKRWGSWIHDYKELFKGIGRASLPAPILSDIVFDEKSNIVLGFTDRTSLQAGLGNYSPDKNDNITYNYDSAGDIYKVCKTENGYKNEAEEGCSQHDKETTAPSYPEFFTDEEWELTVGGNGHKEIALGSLAYEQGSNHIFSSAFDPINLTNHYNSSGLIGLDLQTGTRTSEQLMVEGASYNGKAGGIGDIELLSAPAPTEIGNRVWYDENANCLQDANENGIAGVDVSLYASSNCTGLAEKTVKTDENGRYLFSVNAGTTYSVCINNIDTQTVLNEKKLTCNTKGTAINNSDAIAEGKNAKIAVAPLTTGANDHSFDFGFTSVKKEVEVPVTVTPTPENNRTVDHTDGTCNCHSYKKDSASSLNIWGMMIIISLTSLMGLLFRKDIKA